ncbi:homeobox protein MOX-2-like, partial [Venturia canescens]|uniref:homeobox protein MOX-2-like n=1 Tax=Venturia canescens TaxID=32260 RepID=UPI001C9C66E4
NPTRSLANDGGHLLALQQQRNSFSSTATIDSTKFSSPGRHSLPRKKQQQQQQHYLYHHHHHHHHRYQHQHSHRNGQQLNSDNSQSGGEHFEYFVPRSVSEFNLAAAVQDTAITPPVTKSPAATCNATPPIAVKTRCEKVVTFEDEAPILLTGTSFAATPTRKNSSTPVNTLENVFM